MLKRKTLPAIGLSLITLAVLSACGGGGGSGGTATPAADPSVRLSGTAATGAALANASVSVKCAQGSGTATTDASGLYSLTLSGGALPCVIQVSGEQGGVAVTLHSVAEAGSTDAASGITSAAANVTPLTEMIVAQLSASLPSELFAGFGSGSAVSTDQLVAATKAVLNALKDATGIDITAIDPFKATLVAATSAAPSGGNLHDQLLDQLGAKVTVESLPQVVNQIASAAGSGGSTSVADVMQAVEKGPLAGCPVAVSGRYRTVDHFGLTTLRDIDFSAMTYKSPNGTVALTITADSAKPCEFVASGTQNGDNVRFDIAMGTAGLAVYRSQNLTQSRTSVGYLFPQQNHAKSALVGQWNMLQSGYAGDTEGFVHWMNKLTVKADDAIDLCDIDYRSNPGTCTPETDVSMVLAARSDGGFDINDSGSGVASVYGYRSPAGVLNAFGTTNADGVNTPTTEQTHFILTKHAALAVPAVGTVSKYFDTQFSRVQGGSNATTAPKAESNTVTAVSGSAVTRTRASDSRIDTVHYNDPLPGVRRRAAGQNPDNTPFAEVYQVGVPGAGLTVSINANPFGPSSTHIYAPSVQRN